MKQFFIFAVLLLVFCSSNPVSSGNQAQKVSIKVYFDIPALFSYGPAEIYCNGAYFASLRPGGSRLASVNYGDVLSAEYQIEFNGRVQNRSRNLEVSGSGQWKIASNEFIYQ